MDLASPPPPGRAALRLSLFLTVGDEVAPTARLLEDAIALDHLVEAAQELLGVLAGPPRNL